MEDTLQEALNEVKRVDHLIHVSLKYTRTVDVLISVLQRFISCIDFLMDALILKAIEDKMIEEKPISPITKVNAIKKIYADPKINENLELYTLYRRLVRSAYTKRNEYRRYVTMTVDDQGTIIEIDIDKVVEYFEVLKDFISHVKKIIFE